MKKVLVAMSGGVDSSVVAYLLEKEGYDVTGVFCHFWSEKECEGKKSENTCCSVEAEKLACKVCQELDIPFYSVDVSKKFKKHVVDYFVSSYENGETPNPCVVCNDTIKFAHLIDLAQKKGYDYLATGHYVQNQKVGETFFLKKGIDATKDQSYFLYTLTQEILSKTLFPLGTLTKKEVRAIAKKIDLPTATRRESQEVCFVSKKRLEGFLKRHMKKWNEGDIVDQNGAVIGTHKGLPFYTLGQRRNIGVGGTGPYYVFKRDFKTNTLFVTNDSKDPALYSTSFTVRDVNWLGELPSFPFECKGKVRYRKKAVPLEIVSFENGIMTVGCSDSERAIMPGQSVVFYDSDTVLGGGVIHPESTSESGPG
ncbi:tRNA 2-thiouridine(34) synthase MnmA [Patescibacteria group bacterium]|nr:tRNA 2-thiouridine(34) synthase MnmA [Patescibacteria group bacterium]